MGESMTAIIDLCDLKNAIANVFSCFTSGKEGARLEKVTITVPPSKEGKAIRIKFYVRARSDKGKERAMVTADYTMRLFFEGVLKYKRDYKVLKERVIIWYDFNANDFLNFATFKNVESNENEESKGEKVESGT